MPALRVQIAQVREERAGNTDDDVLRYVGAWLLDRVEGEDSEKEDIMKYMDFSWVSRKAAAGFKYGAKRLKMVVKHPEPATLQIYTIVPAFGWKKKDDIALQTLTLGKSIEGEDYAFGGKVKTKVTKKENKDLLFHTEFILSKKKKSCLEVECPQVRSNGCKSICNKHADSHRNENNNHMKQDSMKRSTFEIR